MKTLRILLLIVGLGLAVAANATTIEMTVNGLVCGFCAQGIEKTLRKDPATEDVVVSLEHRLVAVATKPGTDIADEALESALEASGYDVKAITRTDRSIQA
ncbi:MAG: heavy-metal-associated domain-containing protein, partial [Steroidobacteraceae bacterium]